MLHRFSGTIAPAANAQDGTARANIDLFLRSFDVDEACEILDRLAKALSSRDGG